MNSTSPQHIKNGNQRLMRYGYWVTGGGQASLMIGLGCLFQSVRLPAAVFGALVCGGLALSTVGFSLMVVAADPFSDDDVDAPM